MTGNVAQKNMVHMKRLVDVAYAEEFDEVSKDPEATRQRNLEVQKQWHDMMDHFNAFMGLVELKATKDRDLTPPEIDQSHIHGALFFAIFAAMFPESIGNYLHLIGAGHITYFLRRYGSLYKFSQQGWEALNKLIKSFYHHNTNHGGCHGNSRGAMIRGKHLLPIACLNSRRLCWITKIGDAFFLEEARKKAERERRFKLRLPPLPELAAYKWTDPGPEPESADLYITPQQRAENPCLV